jgi:hypothetical protein
MGGPARYDCPLLLLPLLLLLLSLNIWDARESLVDSWTTSGLLIYRSHLPSFHSLGFCLALFNPFV